MKPKEAAIKLKLQKAQFLLSEIDVLLQYKFYATVVNRLYYACFHATKAYCLLKIYSLKPIVAWWHSYTNILFKKICSMWIRRLSLAGYCRKGLKMTTVM